MCFLRRLIVLLFKLKELILFRFCSVNRFSCLGLSISTCLLRYILSLYLYSNHYNLIKHLINLPFTTNFFYNHIIIKYGYIVSRQPGTRMNCRVTAREALHNYCMIAWYTIYILYRVVWQREKKQIIQ